MMLFYIKKISYTVIYVTNMKKDEKNGENELIWSKRWSAFVHPLYIKYTSRVN